MMLPTIKHYVLDRSQPLHLVLWPMVGKTDLESLTKLCHAIGTHNIFSIDQYSLLPAIIMIDTAHRKLMDQASPQWAKHPFVFNASHPSQWNLANKKILWHQLQLWLKTIDAKMS